LRKDFLSSEEEGVAKMKSARVAIAVVLIVLINRSVSAKEQEQRHSG
jgi:hypothetical protein